MAFHDTDLTVHTRSPAILAAIRAVANGPTALALAAGVIAATFKTKKFS